LDFEEVERVLQSLEQEKVDYAIFGAMAMNLHGLVRATEDIDLFVRPDRENLERLKRALRRMYNDPNIDEINTEELLDDYPAVRYAPPGTELYFDILTRLGEIFRWNDLEIQRVESEHGTASVISPRMLVRMKANTVRLKDRQDAAWIREAFGIEE
jgi:hypothetical protein